MTKIETLSFRQTMAAKGKPRDYGRWQYNSANRTARLMDGKVRRYEVDFDRFPDAAATLDWIMQVHQKTFVTDADVRGLLKLIADVVNPQGTQCSWAMAPRKEKLACV